MIHPQDPAKNFSKSSNDKFKQNKDQIYGWQQFYQLDKLQSEGYIDNEGSLHFKFCIAKSNLLKRLRKSEAERERIEGKLTLAKQAAATLGAKLQEKDK